MIAAVVVAAVLLRLLGVGEAAAAMPLALFLLILALFEARPRDWLFAGALVGALQGSILWVALAKWGPTAALGLWLVVVIGFAAGLGVVGVVAARAARRSRAMAIAGAWVLVLLVLDHVYTAVFLTAPWVFVSPTARVLVSWLGATGTEGAVVLACASGAAALHLRDARPAWPALALAPLWLSATWVSHDSPRADDVVAMVHVVQPNFSWRTYADRAWSMDARRQLVGDLEALTREAAMRGPGTIVWPENGSGLPDAQVATTRERLQRSLRGRGADLITVGVVYEAGGQHIAGVHLTEDGVVGASAKAWLVPLAERDVTPGQARVLDTVAGPLGLSICYDVLFGDHVRSLVDAGAELLVVSSDDASFGLSLISRWHVAHAVLRAAEVGRSLVFASNRGPAVLYDASRHEVRTLGHEGRRAVVSVEAPRRRGARPTTSHALAVGALLLAGVAALRPQRQRQRWRPRAHAWTPATVAVLLLAPLTEVGHTAAVRGLEVIDVWRDLSARARGVEGVDSMAHLFVQSSPTGCGRAALAFALTMLGGEVFEEALHAEVAVDARGSRLSTLASAAETRGFVADAVQADSFDALALGPGRVALIHVRPEHYLVLMRAGARWRAFDPARGRVFEPDLAGLTAAWTGAALVLSHRAPWVHGAARLSTR